MNKSKIIIPFNQPTYLGDEMLHIENAVNSLKHCGNHQYADKVIKLLQQKYDFGKIFLTPSCTAALEMGVLLADIKPGDEIILPSYTFSSTANAFVLRGGLPKFCEINKNTMNMDVEHLKALISPRTKLIMPIDYAGIPCEIEEIVEIANENNIMVLQDSAQSLHSFHKSGRACGSVPQLAAFSFHETKNVNCGEGGALIVNDESLIRRAEFLQEKGTDRSLVIQGMKNKYSWVDVGSSFLLSDILASMLYAQLLNVEEIVHKRGKVYESYKKLFNYYEKNNHVSIPKVNKSLKLNNHAFFVIFDKIKNKEIFINSLKEHSVYAYIGYMPLHSSPMGVSFGYKPEDLKITQDLASRLVRLPMSCDISDSTKLDYCISIIKNALVKIYS